MGKRNELTVRFSYFFALPRSIYQNPNPPFPAKFNRPANRLQ